MPAREPTELHRLVTAGVNAHDVNALMELYEPDPAGRNLAGQAYHGADSLRQLLDGLVSAAQEFELSTRNVLVTDDVALMSGDWYAVLATPEGATTRIEGTAAEVARRQPDGTWRFLIGDPTFIN